VGDRSWLEDGRRSGRNYRRNVFRNGSSEYIDMCKSSAARRLTEVIIIRKDGKILIFAKVCGKDFVVRASF